METSALLKRREEDVCTQEGLLGGWNRAILGALAGEHSRRMLEAAIPEGKTVEQLSSECDVPLSSCYRITKALLSEGLMVIERIVITGDGKRFAVYRTTFSAAEVEVGLEGTRVKARANEAVSEKLHARWFAMSFGPKQDPSSVDGVTD